MYTFIKAILLFPNFSFNIKKVIQFISYTAHTHRIATFIFYI